MIKKPELISFIELAKGNLTKLPRYNSKFSNKIYDNHQKIVLLLIKQKLKLTYRSVIELLYVSSEICIAIDLKRIPEHSTLVKFAKRISASLLDSLLQIKEAEIVAVDSTGFETESKSYYYFQRFNRQNKTKARRYDKLSIAVDTDKQIILSQRIRRGPRNDNIDFRRLLKELKIRYVVADKGYDSKANNHFVLRKKAYPIIARKKNTRAYYEKLGKKLVFDESIYHQRSKAETVFSVIKRKYGSIVRGRSFVSQEKEIICKLLTYNLDRQIKLFSLLIVGFQQSPFS
jgi:IS5 family transposase